jgi:DNA-binding Xre family transcriptional regulator
MEKKNKIAIEREEKINSAVIASATIRSIKQTSSPTIGSMGRVDSFCLDLEIQIKDQETYNTKTWWLIYTLAISQMKIGETISVKVDKKDKQVIYPNIENIEHDWRPSMGYIP